VSLQILQRSFLGEFEQYARVVPVPFGRMRRQTSLPDQMRQKRAH